MKKWIVSTLLGLAALLPLPASAQNAPPIVRRPYPAVGAPADPKVPAQWNRYHDYEQATKLLKDLAAAHPRRARLQSLGKSFGGREMWVMTITNFETGDDRAKPAMWIDGGIHANEIQGPEVVLYTAWYLLEQDGKLEKISQLLKERTFYLLPMLSPDSRDEHFHRANTTHGPRSGQRPVDDDNDGLLDEDDVDDLDGDGHITQMRVADPNGRYKAHPDFPELMVRVKEGEKGQWTLLGWEGVDNDGDGRVNEDGDGFYDPNRNWPWAWQPEYVQNGAHQYPFSIIENRLAADFVMAHENIAGAQSFHNAAGMILRGPGARDQKYEQADLKYFDAIGKTGETILPSYKYGSIIDLLYPAQGSEVDWFYFMRGAVALTNELWTGYNLYRKVNGEGEWFGRDEQLHQFDKQLLLGDGVIKWHPVNHPTYGPIDVGGFKKSWVRQPPTFLLEEELHRNMAFTLHHADQLPLVKVQSVTAAPLGGDLMQVTAIIENTRPIPTRLAVDIKNRITPPDRVIISGENVKVIAALISDSPFFLSPREQKLHPHEVRLNSIGGEDVTYVRWLVQGPGPYEVRVQSIKGGNHGMTVVR